MASNERVRKVSEQIRRELVTILPEVIFHDKINFVSITGISLSRDFKFAKVYITIIGNLDLRNELVYLLNDKHGKIRHVLSKRLTTRTVPDIYFKYDDSIEYGARMEKLLHDIVEEDNSKESNLRG